MKNAEYARQVERHGLSIRILLILLLCSVSLNIFLARNIQNLKESVLYLKAEMRTSRELNPGDLVPPIQANDLDGHTVTVDYSASSLTTIMYIFTPNCSWCTRNIENIKTLLDQTAGTYRFIGLSLSKDKLRDYVSQNDLSFSVYCEASAEAISAYKMGGTPRTLVVSTEGRILKNWFGAYRGNLKREVEEYFKVSLPGVIEDDREKKENKGACETCNDKSAPQS